MRGVGISGPRRFLVGLVVAFVLIFEVRTPFIAFVELVRKAFNVLARPGEGLADAGDPKFVGHFACVGLGNAQCRSDLPGRNDVRLGKQLVDEIHSFQRMATSARWCKRVVRHTCGKMRYESAPTCVEYASEQLERLSQLHRIQT